MTVPEGFWYQYFGPSRGTFTTGADLAKLNRRAAALRSRIRPEIWRRLSDFDKTRLVRALEALKEMQAGKPHWIRFPWGTERVAGGWQTGGFKGGQRMANLRHGIHQLLAEAETAHAAAQRSAVSAAERRLAAEAAAKSGRMGRLFSALTRTPGMTAGLFGVLIIAVFTVVVLGPRLWQGQTAEDPGAGIFVGPAVNDCARDVFSGQGLIWSVKEGNGWRAPGLYPEPFRNEFESDAEFETALTTWRVQLEAGIQVTMEEARSVCGDVFPPASIQAYHITGPAGGPVEPPGEDRQYNAASLTIDLDPDRVSWIAVSSRAALEDRPTGRAGVQPADGQPDIIAPSVDDYVVVVADVDGAVSDPVYLDQNDAYGSPSGNQAVLFGSYPSVYFIANIDFSTSPVTYTVISAAEGGMLDGFLFEHGPGTYTFDFSFRNVYTADAGHQDLWLLVAATGEE